VRIDVRFGAYRGNRTQACSLRHWQEGSSVKELVYSQSLLPLVERCPDKVGFVDGDVSRTYGAHLDRVAALTHALRTQLGIAPADRYAVLALNSLSFLELWHAAFLGGGVINPLNLRLAPAELAYILSDSGTKVCFTDAFFAGMVDEVRAQAGIDQVVLIGAGDVPHDIAYEELVGTGSPVLPAEPEEDDPVVLMYTGGTTGLPKGALLEHRAEVLNLYHLRFVYPFDDAAVFLHQTPMFHAASMPGVLGMPASGGLSTFVPAFEPGAVLDTIERHRVTMTVMVPTMIALMLMHPAYDPGRLRSLRVLGYGASPMPLATLARLRAELPEVDLYQGYGMTEASALLTVLDPEDHRAGGVRLTSAGRALPGVVVSIRDDRGNALPPGERGEVWARGGNFMREYWNQPEQTEEVFRDGWYHTGDAGYLDEDGYLFLVDRMKDMIVTGGENVYSVEVENAIASHPAVAQVAVIGIPHEMWGEAVHAVVVLREGCSTGEKELLAHARASIAGYKVPKSIAFQAEPLPLSGALKVLKRELRKQYWQDRDG
jgi:acyl-CoA synthetase (AMP-forming)/AMP-acid ligase II